MNVVLYGATGMIGSRVLTELLSRGHHVTAVARNPSKVSQQSGVTAVQGDALDAKDVAAKVAGADVVVSSYAPPQDGPGKLLDAVRVLISGVKEGGAKRLLVVGGAGSLLVAPGVDLDVNTEDENNGGPTYAAVTARSYHSGGVNCLCCDGSVRFIKNSINWVTWRALGTIASGEAISSDAY